MKPRQGAIPSSPSQDRGRNYEAEPIGVEAVRSRPRQCFYSFRFIFVLVLVLVLVFVNSDKQCLRLWITLEQGSKKSIKSKLKNTGSQKCLLLASFCNASTQESVLSLYFALHSSHTVLVFTFSF